MTKQEAWVRFMAGALAGGDRVEVAAKVADKALAELLARWPESVSAAPRGQGGTDGAG